MIQVYNFVFVIDAMAKSFGITLAVKIIPSRSLLIILICVSVDLCAPRALPNAIVSLVLFPPFVAALDHLLIDLIGLNLLRNWELF